MMQIFKRASAPFWRRLNAGASLWIALFPGLLAAEQVTLGWNPSEDPRVAGYYVYHGTAPNFLPDKFNAGTNVEFTYAGAAPGVTHYFAASSYSGAGVESAQTPEISYEVPTILNRKICSSRARPARV